MFPEPAPAATADVSGQAKSVESQEPPPNESIAQESSTPKTEEPSDRKTVTTQQRAPLKVPETVHVRINPDNLKDYVGPPIYHKDRLYTNAPPPGVSTGLGYLGNGSGAVMPVEATVRSSFTSYALARIDIMNL